MSKKNYKKIKALKRVHAVVSRVVPISATESKKLYDLYLIPSKA